MNNILETLLNQAITRRQVTDTAERDNSKFRVSDAGKCRLMRFWKRQGKPAEKGIPIETLRAMQQGINVHEYIQTAIADLPGVEHLVTEHRLEDEHRIGHFDLLLSLTSPLIDDADPIRHVLCDIKSKGSKQWHYFDRDGRQSDVTHVYQLTSYWLMAKDQMPIDACTLVYINRDTLEMHENDVNVAYWAKEVESDWNLLINAWERQEAPEPCPATHYECRYCPYYQECGF